MSLSGEHPNGPSGPARPTRSTQQPHQLPPARPRVESPARSAAAGGSTSGRPGQGPSSEGAGARRRPGPVASPVSPGQLIATRNLEPLGLKKRHRIDPSLRRLDRGLYTTADTPDSLDLRLAAAMTICPGGSAIVGLTALRLHGVALPAGHGADDQPIHVAVPVGQNGGIRSRDWLKVHHPTSTETLFTQVNGYKVASPADAWIQACPALRPDDRIAVGDRLLDYSKPPSSLELIDDALARHAGHRGIRAVRTARRHIRPGTESIPETYTRLTIVANGLPEPQVNVTILDDDGRFVSRCDLAYPRWRIAIEYDGAYHDNLEQRRKDEFQRNTLRNLGWLVIVVRAGDLHAATVMLEAIRAAIATQSDLLAD